MKKILTILIVIIPSCSTIEDVGDTALDVVTFPLVAVGTVAAVPFKAVSVVGQALGDSGGNFDDSSYGSSSSGYTQTPSYPTSSSASTTSYGSSSTNFHIDSVNTKNSAQEPSEYSKECPPTFVRGAWGCIDVEADKKKIAEQERRDAANAARTQALFDNYRSGTTSSGQNSTGTSRTIDQ